MSGHAARTIARAEEATRILHETEELERVAIHRAAQLLTPRVSYIRTNSEWYDRAEVTLPSGNRARALQLYPVPQPCPPEVLRWRWFDGRDWHDEPVAKLVRTDGAGAVYGLSRSRAARDFGHMLDDLGDAAVHGADVIFGD